MVENDVVDEYRADEAAELQDKRRWGGHAQLRHELA
jgi:hypothetical protein